MSGVPSHSMKLIALNPSSLRLNKVSSNAANLSREARHQKVSEIRPESHPGGGTDLLGV